MSSSSLTRYLNCPLEVLLRKDASSLVPGFTFGEVGPHFPVCVGGGSVLDEALEGVLTGGDPGGVSIRNCLGIDFGGALGDAGGALPR